MGRVVTKTRGLAQLFRLDPVLSWGGSAFALGVTLAVFLGGPIHAPVDVLLAGVTVALAQGITAHALNDAYDWYTGTDKESIGKGTGGSRVIPEEKLSLPEVVVIGIVSLLAVLSLAVYFALEYGGVMYLLVALAVLAPVAYSVPPLKLGYRPFNEVVVVIPALTAVVVGAELVASGSFSWQAIPVGITHASFCTSWFVVSRIPDYEPDRRVGKVTSVVYVGRDNAKLLSAVYVAFGMASAVWLTVELSYLFAPWLLLAGLLWLALSQLDPYSELAASTTRLGMMTSTTLFALAVSALLLAGSLPW
jgi:1,4-dihydroxy-2-naphthoate octaprenyltransferase